MSDIISEIQKEFFENQDIEYRDFNAKLLPTVDRDTMIGIRTPVIRNIAKKYAEREDIGDFLSALPHRYYDENNIHGAIISLGKDLDTVVSQLNGFLPYVDNWATCDLIRPKMFKKHTEELMPHILGWIESGETYTVRFGIEMLMSFCLKENFREEHLELVAGVKSNEYYVNMAISWYFATALAFQYASAVKYLEQNKLDKWTHNMTVKKACESFRVTEEQKVYLKTLRIR